MLRRFAVGLMAMAVSAPVGAHWQFTRWGMTPEQVIAASSGTAQIGAGDQSSQGDTVRGATGRYQSGEYSFSANYWFTSAGLKEVTLALRTDQQCTSLERDLTAKYGAPVERTGLRRMWADAATENRVTLIVAGFGYCELQYAQLNSSSAAGL